MKLLTLFTLIASTFTSLHAQEKATIVRFHLDCNVNVNYDIWDDDFTADFFYTNDKNKRVRIRTVDTIFSYAQQAIARKLGVKMDKQSVSSDSKQNMVGRITGFPNDKIKDLAYTKFDKLIELLVTVMPSPGAVKEKGSSTTRKYQIDMLVDLKVYDKSGSEIERFKKRTRMDEVKETVEVRGVRDTNDLSGTEMLTLFAKALDNALENKN